MMLSKILSIRAKVRAATAIFLPYRSLFFSFSLSRRPLLLSSLREQRQTSSGVCSVARAPTPLPTACARRRCEEVSSGTWRAHARLLVQDLPPPRLFHCSNAKQGFQVREVPHFSQADFYEDDVMILDCYNEVSDFSLLSSD
jgi:hypothetical protein